MTDMEPPTAIQWEEDNPDEPEFDVDLRSKIVDHEVFDAGYALQWKLDEVVVTRDKFDEAWQTIIPSVEVLDKQVGKAGLLGLKAGVRGRNISLPETEMDFAHERLTIQPMSDVERREELAKTSLNTDEVRGPFVGYSLRFRRNPEVPDTYVPQLVYQLSLREMGRQHAYIMPMATGDVDISELFFDADERVAARKDILERLFATAGEQGAVIDTINRILADAERFDDGVLRRVGYDVDRLVGLLYGSERQHIEDALSDLIGNYVDLSLRNKAAAHKPMKIPLDATAQSIEYLDGLHELNATPTSIDFFDWPAQHADGSSGFRRTCSLVFDQGDHLVAMPLFKLERFE